VTIQLTAEPVRSIDSTIDLLDALDSTWRAICRAYDAIADLPELATLFDGADLALPDRAAETVVANMLLEVMEEIPRFSAWYKRPLGVVRDLNRETNQVRWYLSPETQRQWQTLVNRLAVAIEHNIGVILAGSVLDDADLFAACADSRALAFCRCAPPRVILVDRAVLGCSEIVCDACQQPFITAASDLDH
jgi:hypothetical protein